MFFCPPPFMKGATGLTLSFLASATSNTSSVTIPGSSQAGDLAVLLDFAQTPGSTPSTSIPTGFSSAINVSGLSNSRMILSYKILAGGDAGASASGMSGGLHQGKTLFVFRGSSPVASVTVGSPNSEVTTANPASQIVAASAGAPPLIVVGGYGSSVAITTRTFSPDESGEESASSGRLYCKYRIYNSGPSDTTIDKDDDGTNALISCYLAVA